MTKPISTSHVSRRGFLKVAGGAALAVAGASVLPQFLRKTLLPEGVVNAQSYPPPDLFYAGTDGWISLPATPAIVSASLGGVKTHPDDLAPAPFTTYIFGFRNVTGLTDTQRANQKNNAQHTAPMFWVDQFNPAAPRDFRMQLTNLGLALRPDLFDAHTLHWHGFRNVIPFFDGEPTGSVAVTTGRIFQYIYRPRDPGTYMFHCHVEDVEHVHMGMTGPVFVRPLQNGNTSLYPSGKYAYNDGDGSTGYDREFAMLLSEVWCDSHWADAHIQLPEWSDYRADFALLNGRVYPDTLAPNGVDRSVQPGPRCERRPDRAGRPARPAIPAALGAGDLQRRRARAAALRQPRFPGVGDDARRHQDAGGRQGRHADEGPRRHRHQLRGQHRFLRRGREHRRHLHRAAEDGAWDTTPTSSTTASTSGRTTWLAASAASGPRCASTRPAPCRRRAFPTPRPNCLHAEGA